MDKSRPKENQGSSWNDEKDRMTNPNKRQEEDRETNVESPRSGQRASTSDPGSSESQPSDKDERLHGGQQGGSSRNRETDTTK
ncbi:MAG TPA: hypothetical protein VFZ73_10095 [Gemmatimonadaceae bacterium]